MAALDLIVGTAPRHHASVTDLGTTAATFSVNPVLPSGKPGPGYLIHVETGKADVSVRELVPTRLPAFCPERHINFDGSFCLNWAELEPMVFRSEQDATDWWLKILAFLNLQHLAGKLRRWPAKGDARAHGPSAALYQVASERLATMMGSSFERRLHEGRFRTTSRNHNGQPRIRMMSDARRLCTVVPNEMRVMTVRARCPCDSNAAVGLPLCSCHDHASVLARLVLALHGQEREERLFFDEIRAKNYACCGTLNDCPLAA